MTSLRPPRAYSLSQCRSGSSHDSRDDIRELPLTFLSPASSKPDSLKPNSVEPDPPSRRVLFSYQHVLFLCRKSAVSLSSLIRNRTIPEPVDKPVTKPNAQPRSFMSLKIDRLKDKWYGFKTRTSPAAFRCAGYIFFILILIVAASIIIGWYGLTKETIAHQSVTVKPTQTTATGIDYNGYFQPAQTPTRDQLFTLSHRDVTKDPTIPARHLLAKNSDPTTSSEETEDVTVLKTVIVTVTSVITDTAMKTLTTTVFLSTCTTCVTTSSAPTTSGKTETTASQDATAGSVMTGIMYCSFTGRRNIYTLCPLVHTDSPGMLTDTPVAVSSATPRMKNSFSAVRIALLSLWNSLPSLGRVMQGKESGRCSCDCDCGGMKKKLDAAVELVRAQQRLLESQQAVISEHRKGLYVVLETLANMTAARAGEKKKTRDVPLDLNI
ncbi:hypothetical protein F5Y03DRAFT_399611 [Xylaria venustula]|nr:hypothetical protein F5Y03DRAFT_399611 [Xylaria venustula]